MTRKEYELVFQAIKSYRVYMTPDEEVLSEKILDDLFYTPLIDKLSIWGKLMRFIQTYKSPNVIGIGDNVKYKNKNYQVLINYIKGETDAKGYTPKSNRTILIDDNDNRIICDDYKQLIIEDSN